MGTEYQAFYTKSLPILSYMVDRLRPVQQGNLLEPCAGSGLFVSAVLEKQPGIGIDAYELDPAAAQLLLEKFGPHTQVNVTHTDTLLDQDLQLKINMGGYYDYVIANPPYGAWQEYEKRRFLKRLYPGLYVRETYGLFLYQALCLLKPGGRLVFIVPDTFLNLHMHKPLRHHLLTEGCIEEIALFPSSFFPSVNFGYSNLCILTLHRSMPNENTSANEFDVRWNFQSAEELAHPHSTVRQMRVQQGTLLAAMDHALFVTEDPEYTSLISGATERVSDVASCVTGIYSGNDKSFLRVLSQEVRNGKKYQQVIQSEIYDGPVPPLEGIRDPLHFVPIVKGGGVRFFKPDLWFLDWSVEAVNHYKTDRKARFQNSDFYFRQGIALPMVSSSNVTAALMEQRLFDQSIVGIFPHDRSLLYYLLGFFNTDLCTTLLRMINPSANNSANYVKKLPFIKPSLDELHCINRLVQHLVADVRENGGFHEEDRRTLNEIYRQIYMDELRLANVNIQAT